MAVNVFVHDDRVDVDLSGWDRVWALKGHLEVPMDQIIGAWVASRDDALRDIGWRVGGGYLPGRMATGHFTAKGRKGVRQLWSVYTDDEVLVIETKLDDPWRVVLQHPDREFLAWIISERAHRDHA
jgi:hypothetical protein